MKYLLEQCITEGREDQFPLVVDDLINKYREFEDTLNKEVHPKVNEGAATKGDGRLTEHGIPHIIRVFDCAYKLAIGRIADLKGYEIFMLCIAIHLHDIGNLDGRGDHENHIRSVVNRLKINIPTNKDSTTHNTIISIAEAHGGISAIKRDNDTFFDLARSVTLFGDFVVRPALIASILRFADELSDFFKRTDDIVDIPRENELFHAFSSSLHECLIEGRTISIVFRIKYAYTQKMLTKGSSKGYLYDWIMERLSKLMRELEYCSKYSEGFIQINAVSVKLLVTKKDNESAVEYRDEIPLCLRGYPDATTNSLDYYLDFHKDTKEMIEPKCKTGRELKAAIKGRAKK